jgi:hypothetical protein
MDGSKLLQTVPPPGNHKAFLRTDVSAGVIAEVVRLEKLLSSR